ncbi:DUF2339 domain-containing protein [Aurantiacibacter sp. D1-12]|uniref:DUF2339 domain-containing protein n=1 Tax=Aurantiacibacter sp. D1-12 TaxID=2993658 RepID=UPI00237D0CD8|nr:DUF2339 domain-containing protein [Aurantiacibacter sp. D1-12]MDE1467578.1 DUF2339 domain-containing protein [Aurantiacibacter sp. D1-12]
MEWLIILVLCVAVIALWDRVRILGRRVEEIERHDYTQLAELSEEPKIHTHSEPEAEPAPVPAKARTAPPEEPITQELPPLYDEPPVEAPPPDQPVDYEDQGAGFQLPKFDFEDIFGRRLPIWLGGIALAVGGIFLVRYSIEKGLLGPQVRVALSFLFGLLLLAGAEAAYRFEDRVADPRVRQALAGAGIATLYAAFYLAGAQYGLIGPGVAFGGLALVTVLALALTFRFGLPTAVLGLVGGFATPMMVASEEANVPVLAFYLVLLTAGLALTARRLGNRLLGAAALVGGFVWGVGMLASQPNAGGDVLAVGLYVLALGAVVPIVLGRDAAFPYTRVLAGVIATVQLAALVALAEFSMLTWGLYALLAAALAFLSWGEERLRLANVMALALGIVLLIMWPDAPAADFNSIVCTLAVIGLGLPLMLVWRNAATPVELAQLSVGALGLGLASYLHFPVADNDVMLPMLALTFALLAIVVALGAWRLWMEDSNLGQLVALPVGAAAILAFGATQMVLVGWAEVIGAAAIALVLVELVRRRRDVALAGVAWGGLALTIVTLVAPWAFTRELSYAVGDPYSTRDLPQALVRWGVAALPFAVMAYVEWRRPAARLAEILLALLAYVWLSQIVPGDWLAWTAALAAAAIVWWLAPRGALSGTFVTIAFFWSLLPLIEWIERGAEALSGFPMLASELPTPADALRQILPVALAAAFAWWRIRDSKRMRPLLAVVALATGIVVDHTLFKQLFALASFEDFIHLGMAERTVWQALLMGVGVAILHWLPDWRRLGIGLLGAGLVHFIIFTFLLHNPLWSEQAVGVLPIINWLTPAYLLAGAGVWWLARQGPEVMRDRLRVLGDGVIMLLIAFWALSELRHAFAGSILTATPMTQTEDLLRSLTGIVLALGFLGWGSRTGTRSWRIGSLVLMLLAVFKVFLVDAAGLDDLLRVASFIALGFSLIGIGWFYARLLGPRAAPQNHT